MHYLFYKVDKRDIYIIKFILEAYENMAQVSTIDRELPKIQVSVAPDFLADIRAVIANLQEKFFMQELDEDPTRSQARY